MNISENEAHSAIYCSENEYFARRCRHYKAKESKAEFVSVAKTPEMETSPKTGEDNTLIAVSGVGILSLAGAFVLLKKEKAAEA